MIGAVALGATVLVLHSTKVEPPLLVATNTAAAATIAGATSTSSLDLSAYPDSTAITWRKSNDGVGPHEDWVSYGPTTNLQVPAHSVVTVTIKQYDSGEPIPNPFLAEVRGTVGGTMTVDGETVTKIDADHVGHTFTIHNFPSDKLDPLFVNVPLPAMPDEVEACSQSDCPNHVVTFQFVTLGPGDYAWNCEFPCGGNYANFGEAMSSYGYMSGTLHVV